MSVEGWRYYNHAMIPTTLPHEMPDLTPIDDKSIWAGGNSKKTVLARWTTDFDCGYETNWWYVIKDTPFNIDSLKAKRRYEINKGTKNFEVKKIDPLQYKEELYRVQVAAFSAYPQKYRPSVNKQSFLSSIENWKSSVAVGAFFRETGELCGYALLTNVMENYVGFSVLKTDPQYENKAINAALVTGVLQLFEGLLSGGGYICDGARSINHETYFQDYLEKYFGFRKAYCKLHVIYNPKYRKIIKALFHFRKILLKLDRIGIIHQLNSVLRMEEMVRENDE